MKIKKLLICFVLLTIILFPVNVLAHSTSQSGIINWGESIGWSIDENYHTNGTSTTYYLDPYDPDITSYSSIILTGEGKWSSCISFNGGTSGVGMLWTFYNSNTSTMAAFCNYSSNSSGHLTSWEIKFNTYYTITSNLVAHEFGHAAGMNDLYNSSNNDKMMYGYNAAVSSLHAADKRGVKVILGIHSSHTWEYVGNPVVAEYDKICMVCQGFINDLICDPTIGYCTYCGELH